MKIFTSYFGSKMQKADNTMYVSIARYKPEWFIGPEYKELAPPEELLHYYNNKKKSSDSDIEKLYEDYTVYYIGKVLNRLDPTSTVATLKMMAENRNKENVVLMCYEKSSDFCHRHIVSAWLRDNGYECDELNSVEELVNA